MVSAWMNSPGHRANLLSGDYTEVGLGLALGTPADQTLGRHLHHRLRQPAPAPRRPHARARQGEPRRARRPPAARAARAPPPRAAARRSAKPRRVHRLRPRGAGTTPLSIVNRASRRVSYPQPSCPARRASQRSSSSPWRRSRPPAPRRACRRPTRRGRQALRRAHHHALGQHRRPAARLQPPVGQGASRRPPAPADRGQVPRGLPRARELEERRREHVAEDPRADAPQRPHRMGARERARRRCTPSTPSSSSTATRCARRSTSAATSASARASAWARPRRRRPAGTSGSARSSASRARRSTARRAIGTSAYAPTLSDWPGGGVVGLHGTNEPGLIPGRPSHGCIRLRNRDILTLYRLAPTGTPVDIRLSAPNRYGSARMDNRSTSFGDRSTLACGRRTFYALLRIPDWPGSSRRALTGGLGDSRRPLGRGRRFDPEDFGGGRARATPPAESPEGASGGSAGTTQPAGPAYCLARPL